MKSLSQATSITTVFGMAGVPQHQVTSTEPPRISHARVTHEAWARVGSVDIEPENAALKVHNQPPRF